LAGDRDDPVLAKSPRQRRALTFVEARREQRLAYLTDLFWPQRPVILEMEHYGHSVNRGCWQDGSL